MSQAKQLWSRHSEFVSIRQLVLAIAEAGKRPPTEIATSLWNLLTESESPPEWLQHQDGVTYRLTPAGQETGWFVLEALREGREYRDGWDQRMGFSREQIQSLFESRGFGFPALGNTSPNQSMTRDERALAILETFDRHRKAHAKNPRALTAAEFKRSPTVITRNLRYARQLKKKGSHAQEASPSVSIGTSWLRDLALASGTKSE